MSGNPVDCNSYENSGRCGKWYLTQWQEDKLQEVYAVTPVIQSLANSRRKSLRITLNMLNMASRGDYIDDAVADLGEFEQKADQN